MPWKEQVLIIYYIMAVSAGLQCLFASTFDLTLTLMISSRPFYIRDVPCKRLSLVTAQGASAKLFH
jgi:hypothetical protein